MLLNNLNLIKQHFQPLAITPNSTYNKKNIFITKQYDYPEPLIQKLYISFLYIEQLLKNRSHQEILKQLNTNNSKNIQKIAFGFVYGIIYYTHENKLMRQTFKSKVNQQEREQSQNLLQKFHQYLNNFRTQAWKILNNVTLDLILNYFYKIKPEFKTGFIQIFKYLQKYSLCSDDLFIIYMKSLNFYDQNSYYIRYNIELLAQLKKIIKSSIQNEKQKTMQNEKKQSQIFTKTKILQQVSLMRYYLFAKMVHWQYMYEKLKSIRKYQWPLILQTLNFQSRQTLKQLYQSNHQQCLVFSIQISRFTDFESNDNNLNFIFKQINIHASKPIPEQFSLHYYNLGSILISFFLPLEFQRVFNQTNFTLFVPTEKQKPLTVDKRNVFQILKWIFKNCKNMFSEDIHTKNYLLENTLCDIVRWCLNSHTKSFQMRAYIIQWVFYNIGQNQNILKSVKQAFYLDWLHYLRLKQKNQFVNIFNRLIPSLQFLNYFSFCISNIAQNLYVYILSKNQSQFKSLTNIDFTEGQNRNRINEIIFAANSKGILRIQQIKAHSHIQNSIKNELDLRINQGNYKNTSALNQQIINYKYDLITEENLINQKQAENNQKRFRLSELNENEYYGNKITALQNSWYINMPEMQQNQQDNQVLYSSLDQLSQMPDSPIYLKNQQNQNEIKKIQNLEISNFKRQNPVKIHDLEKQISIENQLSLLISTQKAIEQTKKFNYKIQLQKQFVQQMGNQIQILFKDPSINSFVQFINNLIKVLKQYKKSNYEEMIECFLQQTSKIIYIAFNKQFESFNFNLEDKQKNYLTYFLLKSIHQNWKQSLTIYKIFIYKKITKYLCESFLSCQFSFYYVFLDIFKKGIPNFKEMKLWLFQKQKEKYVIPALKKILNKEYKMHIYQNAQCLKIIT